MSKGRMEAFSDGVIAIIITIMVLELHVPHGADLAALAPLAPKALSYVLSFTFVGIYWNNHHHLLQAIKQVDGRVLWANMHLLFWMSLIPFVTGWMGDNGFAAVPVAAYGIVLWCTGVAYYLLARALVALHGRESLVASALGSDRKGIISVAIYTLAIVVAGWYPYWSCGMYVAVASMWLIPDRRIEKSFVR